MQVIDLETHARSDSEAHQRTRAHLHVPRVPIERHIVEQHKVVAQRLCRAQSIRRQSQTMCCYISCSSSILGARTSRLFFLSVTRDSRPPAVSCAPHEHTTSHQISEHKRMSSDLHAKQLVLQDEVGFTAAGAGSALGLGLAAFGLASSDRRCTQNRPAITRRLAASQQGKENPHQNTARQAPSRSGSPSREPTPALPSSQQPFAGGQLSA